MKRRKITDLDHHELRVQMGAEHYTVAAFRGAGKFDRGQTKTFAEAVALAKSLVTNRPVTIYAVQGAHQSHILNINSAEQEIRMTYLVTWRNYLERVAVAPYVNKDAAQAALNGISDPAVGGLVVDVMEDLKGASQMLVDLYNRLRTEEQKEIKSFHTKSDGQRQLLARIEERAQGQAVLSAPVAPTQAESDPPTQGEDDMTTKKQGKKKAATKANGKRQRVDQDKKIYILVDKNPKREGSAAWERFKLYRNGSTVATTLEKGVWPADIRWDVKQKFIELRD